MWRGDMPGIFEQLPLWPPAGELAGVGMFTLVLVAGIGLAIALGRHRTIVIGIGTIMAGVWLLRFWHAHRMWKTQLVQLYPRTTAELLYCALILCGCAAFFLVERARRRAPEDSPLHSPSGVIGATCAVLLLLAFAVSPTLDRFMPEEAVRDLGNLAWLAIKTPAEHEENHAASATIVTSTSYEADDWTKAHLIDGKRDTGYTSELSSTEHREEWVEVRFAHPTWFSRVILQSSAGGFPVDFTIDVWNGERWLPRLSRRDYTPTYGPELFSWNRREKTDRIRIHATRLAPVAPIRTLGGGYALRLGEIGVYK
jgi:hypothetical protein